MDDKFSVGKIGIDEKFAATVFLKTAAAFPAAYFLAGDQTVKLFFPFCPERSASASQDFHADDFMLRAWQKNTVQKRRKKLER